jgi:hypothetical protein
MKVEDVIKKAVGERCEDGAMMDGEKLLWLWHQNEIFLDPSFWQSLGKAMGWATEKELKEYRSHRVGAHSDDWGGESDAPCYCDKPKDWLAHLHRFIDYLAEGKTPEEFFATF